MTRGLFDAFPAVRTIAASLAVPLLALTLAACESRISAHGHSVDATELDQIEPGRTRLIDLQDILGMPSFEGAFGSGKVYYVGEVMIEPPGGRKRASTRTLIIVSLDENETVTNIEIRDESSGNTIAYLDEKTPTPGDTFGVAEQMFSTLRRQAR
jgi:outer membrane protein assembly factor BamE (lipoprotein component of BamABCDE complex)